MDSSLWTVPETQDLSFFRVFGHTKILSTTRLSRVLVIPSVKVYLRRVHRKYCSGRCYCQDETCLPSIFGTFGIDYSFCSLASLSPKFSLLSLPFLFCVSLSLPSVNLQWWTVDLAQLLCCKWMYFIYCAAVSFCFVSVWTLWVPSSYERLRQRPGIMCNEHARIKTESGCCVWRWRYGTEAVWSAFRCCRVTPVPFSVFSMTRTSSYQGPVMLPSGLNRHCYFYAVDKSRSYTSACLGLFVSFFFSDMHH